MDWLKVRWNIDSNKVKNAKLSNLMNEQDPVAIGTNSITQQGMKHVEERVTG